MNIIAFVVSLFFFLSSLFFKRKSKSISPMILFFALWSFILLLSLLNLYNIVKPSNEAYILIMLMLTFFYLGNIVNMILKNKNINFPKIVLKKERKENKEKNNKKTINNPEFKLFYILSILVIVFNIIDLVIIIKEATAGTPMWKIRNWTLSPYGSSNPILDRRSFIEDAFRSIVLSPFALIIHPIAAYYFFTSENNKKRYIILGISIMVLITSSIAGGGGRLGFIYYFGCFLLAFIIAYRNNQIKKNAIKKYKRMIMLICLIGILFVVIYTTIRTGTGNLFKQIYTYFALPPTLLSIWLPDIKNIEYTYGMTTFFGIHSYFFRVLDTIGLDFLIPQIYNNAYTNILNAEIFKNVGYGVGNAFVTPIYYFLVDGGYPFVCIASFLFGFIVSNFSYKFEKNINVRTFTMYALVMYGIFITFMRIQTAIPSYIISFILAAFILKQPKQIEDKKDGELSLE